VKTAASKDAATGKKKTFGQISFRQQDSFLRKHSGFKMYMNLEAIMKESFRIPQQ
jgi:hypothetical protein